MTRSLFAYPPQARRAGKLQVPKEQIYARARPSRRVRNLFVTQIDQIQWVYRLHPETVNLPASPAVPIINVFHMHLRVADLDEAVLRCVDNAIAAPVIFELIRADQVKLAAAYKRPSESDSTKWVVGDYHSTAWLPAASPRTPLPVALNLAGLYEQMLRDLMPVPARPGETLQAQAERQRTIAAKQRERSTLSSQLQREKQFNRKVEINAKLRAVEADLAALIDEVSS